MVKVKALRNCKFGHEGQMYRFKEGEEQEINVPIEQISTRHFEILNEEKKKYKKEKEVMVE